MGQAAKALWNEECSCFKVALGLSYFVLGALGSVMLER